MSKPILYTRNLLPGGFRPFRKTLLTQAVCIDGPFRVQTREGVLSCPDGWLALDLNGDPYPIASNVFDVTYEPAT